MKRMEIRGLDDQRIAFPMTDRIAVQRPNARGNMLAADAHDARIVVHLGANDKRIARLGELIVVVVQVSHHRRSGAAAVDNATLAQWSSLWAVETSEAAFRTRLVVIVDAHAAHIAFKGNLTIRRIDDERRTILAMDLIE